MSMVVSYLLLCLSLLAESHIHDHQWKQWKRAYNKTYNSVDESHRRSVWEERLARIERHNANYKLGLETYTKGLNQFSDLTWDELRSTYLSKQAVSLEKPDKWVYHDDLPDYTDLGDLPATIDWRSILTAVKLQGTCQSHWAFAAAGALEAQWRLRTGSLVSFSEQQLVDCSRNYGNHGCSGGLIEYAYDYVRAMGIENEIDYPYETREHRCRYKTSGVVCRVNTVAVSRVGNETDLQVLTATRGPVSIGLDAESDFFEYKSGVFSDRSCRSETLTHSALVVGYGLENNVPYWLVRNSWGAWWGEAGYIKISRNNANMCGIASWASIPVLQ